MTRAQGSKEQRRRVGILAVAGIGVLALLAVAAFWWQGGSKVGYEVYEPPPGAWEDRRGRKPHWRKGLRGVVHIRDLRDPWSQELCYTLKGVAYGTCDSIEGGTGTRNKNSQEPRRTPPLGDLVSFGSCAVERVPLLPADHVSVELEVAITRDGAEASLSRNTEAYPGLQECAKAAAGRYREKDSQPGVVEVSLGFWYGSWCDELPTGAVPTQPDGWMLGQGIKGGLFLRMHPSPFGYWLLWCARSEAWQIRVSENAVEVVAHSGKVKSRARRAGSGFVVTDAAGNVMLSATGRRHQLDLFVGGRPVGTLKRTQQPDKPLIELRQSGREPVVVRKGERWWSLGDGDYYLDRQAVADGLPLLTLDRPNPFHLAFVHRIAAFVLMANWQQ